MERRKIKDICLTCISLIALVVLWVIVSNSKPDFFPTPQAAWERFVKMAEKPISKTTIMGHIWISLKRVLTALVLAVVSGIGIGLIMGWSKKVNAVLSPILTALRPIPPIAWIPLVILWFGGSPGIHRRVFSGGIKYGYRCEYGGSYVLKCRPCVQCKYLPNAAPCGYAGSSPGCHGGGKDCAEQRLDGCCGGRDDSQ